MSSILPLAILFAILLLALIGAVIFLLLQQTKTNRQVMEAAQTAARENLTFLSSLQQQTLSSLTESSAATQERLSSQLSASQTQLLQHLEVQTQEVMTTLASSVNQATASTSSTARLLSDLVASSQAMIAAKDSIAFQQIRGASIGVTDPGDGMPYPSTEDLAQRDAEAEAARLHGLRIVNEGLASIMKIAGVPDVDAYPAAGSAFLPAPQAQ